MKNPRTPQPAESLAAKFRGALLGVAVGDALGAPLEGHPGPVPPKRLARLDGEELHLTYTDDTAMTIAMARSFIECGNLDQDHLAAAFADHYRREPGRGYGAGTAELLQQVGHGGDWRRLAAAQFSGQGSYGNGAAMRVTPAALLAPTDLKRTLCLARDSAAVTHTHPAAIDGAAVQAAAVHLALTVPASHPLDRRRFIEQLLAIAEDTCLEVPLAVVAALVDGGRWAPGQVIDGVGNGLAALEAVPAAVASFLSSPDSFRDTLRFAISLGGDTDTIAAMAGSIAAAHLGESAVPRPWLHRTEGVAEVVGLADALHNLAAGPPARRGLARKSPE